MNVFKTGTKADGPPPRTHGDDRPDWREVDDIQNHLTSPRLGPGGGNRTADVAGSHVNQMFTDAGI